MHIFLVRHGQDLNPNRDRLTDADPSLSEFGKEQAVQCGAKIKIALESITATPIIIASPRMRTMEAAKILAEQLGQDPTNIQPDKRLKERDCEAYSGQLIAEVFSHTEDELVSGGMEPYLKLKARLSEFYQDILKGNNAPVIIVTHSGNIDPFVELANVDYKHTLEPDDFILLNQ